MATVPASQPEAAKDASPYAWYVLGILFLVRPDIGLLAVMVWIAIGALLYGVLQVIVALRLRARTRQLV